MRITRLGIIGTGAIAELLIETLQKSLPYPLEHVAFLSTARGVAQAQKLGFAQRGVARSVTYHSDMEAFLATKPEFVVECAGQVAVRDHAEKILKAGIELAIVSTSALTDPKLYKRLMKAAMKGNTRLVLSAGAVGAIDILSASRLSGIQNLHYTSRKQPAAWRGSVAEKSFNLSELAQDTMIFEGNALDAASNYPKNANVAATIALAGLDLESTKVKMHADPAAKGNVHEISFSADNAQVEIRITGRPHPKNPKTSSTTAYALAREVLNRILPIVM